VTSRVLGLGKLVARVLVVVGHALNQALVALVMLLRRLESAAVLPSTQPSFVTLA
jgi:hypothetical protein